MSDIVFTDVVKNYKDKQVFRGFSHTFPEGCTAAIMGPSGSGKTTLIRLMMGLEKPDSGMIEGISDEKFGCVFQEDRLIETASAVENIALIFKNKVPYEAIGKELAAVGIGTEDNDELTKPVSAFSGGMKRRVAIVRAMMSECGTVILDEPFKGLDAELKQKVMGYVEDRLGTRRLILITHDHAETALVEDIVEL